MDLDQVRRTEWESLYEELATTLARFGRENNFGEGDYWIVDDDYASAQHKVCVHQVSFLTPNMAQAAQRLLRGRQLKWELLFVIEDRDPGAHPDDAGLTVTESEIIERWDASRMSQHYGRRFQWRHIDG